MKRSCVLLALLLALTGCGVFQEETPAAPTEWGTDAPTVTPAWTVRPTEAPPEPDPDTPAPEESLPVPEAPEAEEEAEAPVETEAVPVPTPGPLYTSLSELCAPGTVIYVEGEKLTTLLLGGGRRGFGGALRSRRVHLHGAHHHGGRGALPAVGLRRQRRRPL